MLLLTFGHPVKIKMGCPKLTYNHLAEPRKNSVLKLLTSTKSNNKMRSGYVFGFNGKEHDDETYGEGNAYDFGARIYDARLGRWLTEDPLAKKFPNESPFVSMGNNPIIFVDRDGKFKIPIHYMITSEIASELKITNAFLLESLLYGNTINADIIGANDDYHFDGRSNYHEVIKKWIQLEAEIKALDIGFVNKTFGGYDVKKLGTLLHNVQDFYSHSNYVELYIQYYQDAHNGDVPDENQIPTFDEVLANKDKYAAFMGYLNPANPTKKTPGLKTGSFNLFRWLLGIDKLYTKWVKGEKHHDEMAQDEESKAKVVKSKDGKKSINTFRARVILAKKSSKKILKEKLTQ
ncbi:MAG: hypothetical protein K1X81_01580 [Bacteroidia bacterium]|nr:hypothetical protein [Bacteroidia bacterium]